MPLPREQAIPLEGAPKGLQGLLNSRLGCLDSTIKAFLYNATLPDQGWSDIKIRYLLHSLALLDGNTQPNMAGVGEREGRIACPLVADRSLGFAHGIGRSGDLLEVQPKALGSALLQQITHRLLKQALKLMGLHKKAIREAIVLPLATGMSLALAMQALRQQFPDGTHRHKVLWIRTDQQSALKAILSAGLTPIVVENRLEGEEVRTDLRCLEEVIKREVAGSILCVLSCASCFAPRAPDRIVEIGAICCQYGIGHLVNNAYGLQSRRALNLVNDCVHQHGRLDLLVSSTDKNFCVPVGGAVITGPDPELVRAVGRLYPGRASSYALIDLLATLLYLGRSGLLGLLSDRKTNFEYFRERLGELLASSPCRLMDTPHNDVSMAISIPSGPQWSNLGPWLFYRGISGARHVKAGRVLSLQGIRLDDFGAHITGYPNPYLNVASAMGQGRKEIDAFIDAFRELSLAARLNG